MHCRIRLPLTSLLLAAALLVTACRPQPPVSQAATTAVPAPGVTAVATAMPTATPAPTATATVAPTSAPLTGAYTYTVLEELPHDVGAYTQGLVYVDGVFYESTGLRGQSTVRRVDAATGQVLGGLQVPDQYFAEGLTLLDGTLYQLTWQSNVGFTYTLDADGMPVKTGEFRYPTEGWGLTHDGSRLILSDGSDTLYFYDPATFTEVGRIQVHDGDVPVTMLNELEYIDGQVYANVWMTDRIAVIDPADGAVTAWIDLAGLLSDADRTAIIDAWAGAGANANWVASNAVLNGIAYDEETGRIFVTGKLWPKVYVVELEEKQD